MFRTSYGKGPPLGLPTTIFFSLLSVGRSRLSYDIWYEQVTVKGVLSIIDR